jgi:hypothetical protein
MSNTTRYLGLDVHAESISAAIAEGRGEIRSLGKVPNRPDAVRKLIEKLGGGKNLKVCYEAGPTGYALYWQLTKLGVDCEVIAPSLIPKKARVYSMDEGNSESRKGHEASDADGVIQTNELFGCRKGSTLAAMEAGRIRFIDSQGDGTGARNDSLVSDSIWWHRAESEAQKRQGANSG